MAHISTRHTRVDHCLLVFLSEITVPLSVGMGIGELLAQILVNMLGIICDCLICHPGRVEILCGTFSSRGRLIYS